MPTGPVQRVRSRREEQLQAALVTYHATVVIYPEKAVLFAVPNGEKRDKVTAGKLAGKRPVSNSNHQLSDADLLRPAGLGVLPGVVDLILLTPGPKTDLLEVKLDADPHTGSKQTHLNAAQKRFQTAVVGMGFAHHVVRSLNDYTAILRHRGVLTRVFQGPAA